MNIVTRDIAHPDVNEDENNVFMHDKELIYARALGFCMFTNDQCMTNQDIR